MQLKLLGQYSEVSETFLADLRFLAAARPEDLARLGGWLKSQSVLLEAEWGRFEAANPEADFAEEDFDRLLSVTYFVLTRMEENRVTLEELAGDLQSAGIDGEANAAVLGYFESLQQIAPEVTKALLRQYHESAGMPSLKDVNLVCHIRPIFSGYSWEGRPMRPKYDEVMGFAPMVLAELITGGGDGSSQRLEFQMNEEALDDLIEGLARCRQQLGKCKKIIEQING